MTGLTRWVQRAFVVVYVLYMAIALLGLHVQGKSPWKLAGLVLLTIVLAVVLWGSTT